MLSPGQHGDLGISKPHFLSNEEDITVGDLGLSKVPSNEGNVTTIVLHKWLEQEDMFVKQQNSNHCAGYVKPRSSVYIVDAVLDLASRNTQCLELEFINGNFIPVEIGREIALDANDDIACRIKAIDRHKESGDVKHLLIEVFSGKKDTLALTNSLKNLHDKFIERQENELGNNLLYFNQANTVGRFGYSDPRGAPGSLDTSTLKRMALANADKFLTFTKSAFYSNKTFANLYGINMRRIETRLDHFLNNKKWYDDRGIPYQLTIMLSGPPGRGKSSVVRAIANRAHRHIINIAFHSIQTATQLKTLTYSPVVDVFMDDEHREVRKYRIPLDKRITVFDEVDATGPLLRQRSGERPPIDVEYDELTLGDVLQAFEGSVEVPGCIRIVNTNYPELLDKAFTRPGRIDLNIEFKDDDDVEIATIMFQRFFDRPLSSERIAKLYDSHFKMAPVEIHEVFFRFFGETSDDVIMKELLVSNERINAHPPIYNCREQEIPVGNSRSKESTYWENGRLISAHSGPFTIHH